MTNVHALQSASEQALRTAKPKPGLVISCEDGVLALNDALSKQAFGAEDDAFIKGAFHQLIGMAMFQGKLDDAMLKFVGGALVEINPKNGLEALLASQIIANHILTMKFGSLLGSAESIERIAVLEKTFTKLARTTPAQVEALHKLRHGGKQSVTVKHVHVHEGGQAIVGNVEGGRG